MSGAPGIAGGVAPALTVTDQKIGYIGLATRAISFALDAALINLAATVVGVAAALILSLLHLPESLKTVLVAIAGAAYVIGIVAYFVVFWSTTGQTPGARAMQVRVLTADREPLKPRWALVRCAGILLAALPLFAGFVPIMFDSRRRGFQDYLAHTLVVEAPAVPSAYSRRAWKRAEYLGSRQPPSTTRVS
ncbi:MAG TPA: RDD family protein [Solirubrobacteraceae bacterium]|nr:RDD family protein [Solirubrobacteraceae bacterium]